MPAPEPLLLQAVQSALTRRRQGQQFNAQMENKNEMENERQLSAMERLKLQMDAQNARQAAGDSAKMFMNQDALSQRDRAQSAETHRAQMGHAEALKRQSEALGMREHLQSLDHAFEIAKQANNHEAAAQIDQKRRELQEAIAKGAQETSRANTRTNAWASTENNKRNVEQSNLNNVRTIDQKYKELAERVASGNMNPQQKSLAAQALMGIRGHFNNARTSADRAYSSTLEQTNSSAKAAKARADTYNGYWTDPRVVGDIERLNQFVPEQEKEDPLGG